MNTSSMKTTQLQTRLKELGLYKELVDGDYGTATKAAVVELQEILTEHNLYNYTIDGRFGNITYNGLKEYNKLLQVLSVEKLDPIAPKAQKLDYTKFIYGAVLSDEFLDSVYWIAEQLRHPSVSITTLANDLLGCMAWESAETFSPAIRNAAGSGATGLIQFMPLTAKGMGTTVDALAKMSQIEQLNYVYKYFLPYKGRLKNLGDVYMTILWPAGVGKNDSYVLWNRNKKPTTYRQNSGLDVNKDGDITRAECIVKVTERYNRGKKKMRKA